MKLAVIPNYKFLFIYVENGCINGLKTQINNGCLIMSFFLLQKVTEREEAAVEEQIIPQTKPNEESSYHRSYTSYNKTEEPVTKEEPVLQQTSPSYEKIEEEKPTIRVHRSRPPEEGKCY